MLEGRHVRTVRSGTLSPVAPGPGDIVIFAGRIEEHAYDIPGPLKVDDPVRLPAKKALGKVRALAGQGLPPRADP
ncbi:hypothetical protein J2Y41_004526 [Arthrobacter sp. 1088]|uniref:hypothetical protein n=1 Tax=Arthrobacter sp. 1088 TaxID=2817768 RepID=UPI00285B4E14|nr:hypothetical protein [Arthrobacter sp. 1088]MDR6688928.1 hypothetical protein [Arthrobacter sp. 1088]